MDEQHELQDALRRLVEEGGTGNFVVVEAGPYYLQVMASAGQHFGHLEAVSNAYLEDELVLSDAQSHKLRGYGFRQVDEFSNWQKEINLSVPSYRRSIATEILDVLRDVYRCEGDVEIKVVLEDAHTIENPELRRAFRTADSLFDAMESSKVIVPVSGRDDDGEEQHFFDDEGMIVFTEDDEYREWLARHGEGHESIVCLMPVAARRAGGRGLSVNPGASYSFCLTPDESALLFHRWSK